MEPYERLDAAMNERRLSLRLNWRQVAEAASISYTALRAIRRGDYRPAELTARALDEALKWVPGSTLIVLAGGEPTAIEDVATLTTPPTGTAASLSQELDLAARLLAATVKEMGLSPEEADEVWARVRSSIVADHEGAPEAQEPPTPPLRRQTGS
jgi:transcriptional regulator with XRE-family HTH domain